MAAHGGQGYRRQSPSALAVCGGDGMAAHGGRIMTGRPCRIVQVRARHCAANGLVPTASGKRSLPAFLHRPLGPPAPARLWTPCSGHQTRRRAVCPCLPLPPAACGAGPRGPIMPVRDGGACTAAPGRLRRRAARADHGSDSSLPAVAPCRGPIPARHSEKARLQKIEIVVRQPGGNPAHQSTQKGTAIGRR